MIASRSRRHRTQRVLGSLAASLSGRLDLLASERSPIHPSQLHWLAHPSNG